MQSQTLAHTTGHGGGTFSHKVCKFTSIGLFYITINHHSGRRCQFLKSIHIVKKKTCFTAACNRFFQRINSLTHSKLPALLAADNAIHFSSYWCGAPRMSYPSCACNYRYCTKYRWLCAQVGVKTHIYINARNYGRSTLHDLQTWLISLEYVWQ